MAFNLDEFIEKYKPHKETVVYLTARSMTGARPSYEIGVDAAREVRLETAKIYAGEAEFVGTETEICVPSPHVEGGVPVTVYLPTSCNKEPAPTILIYFHGGGNVTKCRKTHETVCKILSQKTPCIVVNVEYRLGPEHKFPANHDDAKCVTEWANSNKETLGGSVHSKLGVAGDSAGGSLAAVACHDTKNIIDFAILVYPKVTYTTEYPSSIEFQNGPLLSKKLIDWFASYYITDGDRASPRASVILNDDCSRVPPTLFIVADLDPLRDGCYEYFRKLQDAGVTADLKLIKGVPHTFWGLPVAFKTTCEEAYTAACQFARKYGH